MRIFFEGAHYESEYMTDIESWMYHNTQSGSSFNYLGYYLPEGKSEPVVILPKVFLDDNCDFLKLKPSDFIDFEETIRKIEKDDPDKINLPDNITVQELKESVMGISTWIYRSIAHYIERVLESEISEESHAQNVISKKEEGSSATYLDTILQLFRFAKDHKNLFVFITNVNRQHRNKIVWNKTIKKSLPLFQNGTPIYMDLYSKKKEMDFDEELLKLFFSTLEYLKETFSFDYDSTFNYETYRPAQVEQMLNSGRGTRLLRSIRYKYFSDDMVQLWELLFAYFDKAEKIKSHRNSSELLLVRDYDRVFEDMIDQLIGDDNPLRNQKDGKIIDHIYKDRDLHDLDNYIYYIADSKYYLDKNDLSSESVYKQYTYAKNIIQYNIDLFNSNKEWKDGLRYRDELTEGYNITPNFFIRGTVNTDKVDGEGNNYINNTKDLKLERVSKDKNGKSWDGFRKNIHYLNRLFDRDTLPTQEYTINFMFVLAAYVSNSRNDSYKEAIRAQFKRELTDVINKKYNFYTMSCKPGYALKDEVEKWFRKLNGKIFRLSEKEDIILALERDAICMNESILLLWDLKWNSDFDGFKKFKMGEKIPQNNTEEKKEYKEFDITPIYAIAAEPTVYYANKDSKKTYLFGCYKNKEHLEWIQKNEMYNVRYGNDRRGAVEQIEQAEILVLYDFENPQNYNVYEIIGEPQICSIGTMNNYPKNPNSSTNNQYLVYKIGNLISNDKEYYPQDVCDFVDDKLKGAPVYLEM